MHAETAVLIAYGHRCRNKDMFVVRVKRNGAVANARPCNTCMSMLKKYGIKTVYYTVDNGWSNICLA